MIVYRKKRELIEFLASEKRKGARIGFVPTMGALHPGHNALIRASLSENNITVCSIFVNPVQFNNPEDYSNYPVTINEDIDLLKSTGCQVLFLPDNREMYDNNSGNHLSFHFGHIETVCEGKYRPGHFNGVGLIVTKFFNIVYPDRAYFGQKDLQQIAVVKKLVRDLSYNIEIVRVGTVREPDGLAMSSRNLRIPPDDRPGAVLLYNALLKAKTLLLDGSSIDTVKRIIGNLFYNNPVFKLEYIELVNTENFMIIDTYSGQPDSAFCIAAYCRNIRLIDNILINE